MKKVQQTVDPDDYLLSSAKEWVRSINKYFRISRRIILCVSREKTKRKDIYATTDNQSSKTKAFLVTLYPDNFKDDKDTTLFDVIFHEMCHMLWWPISQGYLSEKTKGKYEEKAVKALTALAHRLAEKW